MRAVFLSAGTGVLQFPYTVDRDTTLVGFVTSKNGVLSYRGDRLIADWTGPSVSFTGNDLIGAGGSNVTFQGPLKIPMFFGEVIYLVSSGGVSAILYFEDPI